MGILKGSSEVGTVSFITDGQIKYVHVMYMNTFLKTIPQLYENMFANMGVHFFLSQS